MIAEAFLESLLVALSATALAIILRNAPWVRDQVQEMKKPWACNVCLPLYLCAVCVGGLYALTRNAHVLLSYLPSYALTYVILEKLARPVGPPLIPAEMFLPAEEAEEESDTPVTRRGFHG
jgi:hypothetical protein